ncbi:MAG: thiol reductant ABC exporter subunit CydC [Oleiphilaceae bacterium]|nr:thiol reductant ABC exporter subunit CydC [Oleiphilaceae bacterium]
MNHYWRWLSVKSLCGLDVASMNELLPWLRLIMKRRGRLAAGAALMALTVIAGLGLLALSGWFITASAAAGLLMAAGVRVAFDVYVPGGGIRFFALTRTLARYGERVYNHNTVLTLLADLRIRLFRGLASRPAASHASRRGSDWLSRLTSDLDNLDTLYLRLMAPTGLALLLSGGLVAMVAWVYSGLVALAAGLMLGAALVVATFVVYHQTATLSRRRVGKLERVRGLSIEHLEAQAELKAAGTDKTNQMRLLDLAENLSGDQAKMDQRIGWCGSGSSLLMHTAAVASLWFGLTLVESGQVSGPIVAALPLALLGLNELYSVLPDTFGRLGGTISSATRLNRDMKGSPDEGLTGQYGSKPQAAIKWQNASFGYPGLPPIITNWSFHVHTAERVGIVGRSGTGKSSLADMAAGLVQPTSGHCWLGGKPGEQPHWQAWLEHVSYLTQTTRLLEDTLRNNLLIGAPEATDAELWHVLEAVCLTELVLTLPQKLDTWLGAYGRQVSGGEARRIALARVLVKPAKLVILDEPFTGLDSHTRDRVRTRISRRLEGKTLVAFAHSTEALPTVDKMIEI